MAYVNNQVAKNSVHIKKNLEAGPGNNMSDQMYFSTGDAINQSALSASTAVGGSSQAHASQYANKIEGVLPAEQ